MFSTFFQILCIVTTYIFLLLGSVWRGVFSFWLNIIKYLITAVLRIWRDGTKSLDMAHRSTTVTYSRRLSFVPFWENAASSNWGGGGVLVRGLRLLKRCIIFGINLHPPVKLGGIRHLIMMPRVGKNSLRWVTPKILWSWSSRSPATVILISQRVVFFSLEIQDCCCVWSFPF